MVNGSLQSKAAEPSARLMVNGSSQSEVAEPSARFKFLLKMRRR